MPVQFISCRFTQELVGLVNSCWRDETLSCCVTNLVRYTKGDWSLDCAILCKQWSSCCACRFTASVQLEFLIFKCCHGVMTVAQFFVVFHVYMIILQDMNDYWGDSCLTVAVTHIYTRKLPSTTTVLPAGYWGVWGGVPLLKGKCFNFHFPFGFILLLQESNCHFMNKFLVSFCYSL